jgi:hypothetical protein
MHAFHECVFRASSHASMMATLCRDAKLTFFPVHIGECCQKDSPSAQVTSDKFPECHLLLLL